MSERHWTDEEERFLRQALADLQRSYQQAAKPYIDRLVAIEARKPPPPVVVDAATLRAAGIDVSTLADQTQKQPAPATTRATGAGENGVSSSEALFSL